VLEGLLGNVKKYELWVLGALLLIGLCLWARRRFKNARLARQTALEEKNKSNAEVSNPPAE